MLGWFKKPTPDLVGAIHTVVVETQDEIREVHQELQDLTTTVNSIFPSLAALQAAVQAMSERGEQLAAHLEATRGHREVQMAAMNGSHLDHPGG